MVHVNDCLRADGAECWERCDDGRVKMIHALSAYSSSSAEMLHLFFSGTMGLGADPASLFFPLFFLHHQLYYTIKHSQHAQMTADELISAARATRWCVTMMHVFGGIDHLKLLKLGEFMPTA